MEAVGLDETQILKEWAVLSHVKAVKNRRVYVFGEDYAVIPGPRFISIMEKMARVMYPDINWE